MPPFQIFERMETAVEAILSGDVLIYPLSDYLMTRGCPMQFGRHNPWFFYFR